MQYVGEEGFYTLGAFEMHARGIWWHQPLLGNDIPKTPMFAWFIIGICNIIGWEHLDLAPRIISVISNWGTGAILFNMARRMYPQHKHAGWYAVLIYLTMGDVFFWYGWLGYADACFGFFIFAAIASFWIAIEDEKAFFLFLSAILIFFAFMVKNISGHGIFAIAAATLLHRRHRWHILLTPSFLFSAIVSLCLPFVYQHFAIHSTGNVNMAVSHALDNFIGFSMIDYVRHWLAYPSIFFARSFPISFLLLYLYLRKRERFALTEPISTMLWVLTMSSAPFWLSANASPRYMVPFYSLFALLLTGLMLQMCSENIKLALQSVILVIIMKVPYSLLALPYIKDWRPEHSILAVVEEIHDITGNKPIRTLDGIASFQGICAYLDSRRPPEAYIRWYSGNEHQVFVLGRNQNAPKESHLVGVWRLRGNPVKLYWVP